MTAAAFFIGLGYLSPSILYDNHLPVVSFVQALLIRQLQEGKKGNIIKYNNVLGQGLAFHAVVHLQCEALSVRPILPEGRSLAKAFS